MFTKDIFKRWATDEEVQEKKLDPVGKADADIDNDGDVDSTDKYLHNRRKAITKNIKKKKGETASMNPKLDTSSSKDKAGEMEAKESKDLDATNAAKAIKHDCATHVEHATWGAGKCIPGEHTIVETSEGEGYVTHYDVMFEHGLERDVPVEEMKIIKSSSHGHMRKKKPAEQKEDVTHETESGTAKITNTHVHFDNSGYKQKFSHKEVHKMSNGGKVRGFSLEKDNPYHGKDNHVYSNGDEEHHLPTKHLAKLNKESTEGHFMYKDGKKVMVKTKADHDKYTKMGYTMKESRIRAALKSVLESDRAKHYKGATKPEEMDDLHKNNKGHMDMKKVAKDADEIDKLPKAFDDVSKAGRAGPGRKMRTNDNPKGDKNIINKVKEAYASMYTVTLDDLEESMLGHRDAEKLNGGKSRDPNFKSPESHIDHHHRKSGGHEKSGGDADRHRYNVAKKLGYDV